MTQADLIIQFKPAKSDMKAVAALIEPGNERAWLLKMNQLSRGEFVALGKLVYDDKVVTDPIVISSRIETPKKGGILYEPEKA